MEKKKDYTITKINTERGFAEEVFKKYRNSRYGIGTCCGSNLPSYIKDKYLCDYQDSKVTQYDSIAITKTTYEPSIETCKKDIDMPEWVDKLCGIKNSDVEIYFYYDATSLGVSEVQAAYTAATSWVAYVQAQEDNTITQENINESCRDPRKPQITEYHTTVFGERWLDWGISALTGTFNNAGSCGGNNTGCSAGAAVDFGLCDIAGAVDSSFPKSVSPTNKFWGILKWAQANNHTMYNGSWYNGSAAGQTVLSTFTGSNTSGSTFSTVTSIGEAPAATKKNVLIVTFIDESSSPTETQPYYKRPPGAQPNPMTWGLATDGTGTAADGSDAVLTPCWKADYDEFIARRAEYLNQGDDYCLNAYCYPSRPANVSAPHWPFALHAVGAISSGDKTLDGSTGTITIVDNPVNGNIITLESTDRTTKTYIAAAATDVTTRQFISTGTVTEVATALKLCIEATNGHNGKITVTQSSGILTVTQTIGGEYGDNTITSTASTSDITVAGFTGGVGDGTWTIPPFNAISNLTNLTLGNPYYDQGYGALDVFGWGINPAEVSFTSQGFNIDLNAFVDFTECNDSECLLFIVKDQNGLPICDHPIVLDGGIVAYTDENGLARSCIEKASIYRTHTIDLCHCITTTGKCASQKINMVITDECFTTCEVTPFIACEADDEVISSGNIAEGCTDPLADNYDPNAITDDGSCLYCSSLTLTYDYEDATETGSPLECQDDGWITLTVAGGTGPYTFNWVKNGVQFATTQSLTGLCGGQYVVTVIDSSTPNPCTKTLIITIDQPTTIVYGCMDNCACNYNDLATIDDNSCLYKGCTSDSGTTNFNERICEDTGLVIAGVPTADCNCEEVGTTNYQNLTNWDDCCEDCIYGCDDPNANNYNPSATCNDNSCTYNYNCEETTTGTSTTNSCDGRTDIGQFPGLVAVNDYISNNLQSTPFDDMMYENTSMAAGIDACLGSNDLPLHAIAFGNFNFTEDGAIGMFGGCSFGSPTATHFWPSTWVTAIPDAGTNIWYRSFGGGQNFNDVVNFLNATITDGQAWVNSSGTAITTFTGVTVSGIKNIISASQGSNHSGNNNPLQNLIWPECPDIMFQFNENGGPCLCTSQPVISCECIEDTSGNGIYPDNTCTPASGTNCCEEPVSLYICNPGTSYNDCSSKTLVTNTVFTFGIGLGAALADSWAANYPNTGGSTTISSYYFLVDAGYTNTSCVTVPATNPPSISMYIHTIKFYYNGSAVTTACMGSTGDCPLGNNTWTGIINYIKSNYDYDGTTYPDITGMNYTQLRSTFAINEPGLWDIEVQMRACNCTDQQGCGCIVDPAGTMTSEECGSTCCDPQFSGCTDPTAYNYNANANWSNSSCNHCSELPAGSDPTILVNQIITNPTSGTNCDGEFYAELPFTLLITPFTQVAWQIYDSSLTLVDSGELITNQSPAQNSFTSIGLCNDTYTIMTYWQNIDDVGPAPYTVLGTICQHEEVVTIGTVTTSQLWECVASINDSSMNDRPFLPSLDATIPLTNTLPSGALSDMSIYGTYVSLFNFWFYLNTSSSYFTQPYVAGSTDCTNNVPAVKMTFESIKIKVVSGGATYYDLPIGGSWSDLTDEVSTLTSTNSTDKDYTDIVAALAAYNTGSHELEATYVKEICVSTGCDCVQSATGTYQQESSCNDECCNLGCTDATADNYDATATVDDGSCQHCTGFTALISLQQDSVAPVGSTIWTGTNINVNNASIAAAPSGGSGNYHTKVEFQGYSNNYQLPDHTALWPGTYRVTVTDTTNNCKLVFNDITVGKLDSTCHDGVTNFTPSQTWINSTSNDPEINFMYYCPNCGYLSTGNGTIYNNTAANSGFTVDNLATHSAGYNIRILEWNGSTFVNVVYNTGVTSLSSGAKPAGKYMVELEKVGETCKYIGYIFDYDGAAHI